MTDHERLQRLEDRMTQHERDCMRRAGVIIMLLLGVCGVLFAKVLGWG